MIETSCGAGSASNEAAGCQLGGSRVAPKQLEVVSTSGLRQCHIQCPEEGILASATRMIGHQGWDEEKIVHTVRIPLSVHQCEEATVHSKGQVGITR